MSQNTKNKQIDFNSDIVFSTASQVKNMSDGTASSDAVSLSQLTAVEALISSLEWQDSLIAKINYIVSAAGAPASTTGATVGELAFNTNDGKIYTATGATAWGAGVAMSAGDRYGFLVSGTGTATSTVATATNNIYEWDGSAADVTVPTTGMFVSIDTDSNNLYYWGGSSWTTKSFEATTASTGLVKVGNDIRLDASAAGDGIAFTAGVLSLDLNELTGAAIDVAADSIAFLDATDGSTKIESVSDMVNLMAGEGLSSTLGVMALDINGMTTTATDLAALDLFAYYDTSASTHEKITWNTILTGIDTSIFDAGNFVDGDTIDFTVTPGTSVTAEVKLASLHAAYISDTNVPTAGQVLSAATSTAGTDFTWIDNGAATTPARVRNASAVVAIGVEGIAVASANLFNGTAPASNTIPTVFVNGLAVHVGDVGEEATAECWFAETGVNGTAVSFASLSGNENLVWDGPNAGYALDANDTFQVDYAV